MVGLGCTGGQHRSVTFASLLRDYFGERYENVRLGMRDMRVNQKTIVGGGLKKGYAKGGGPMVSRDCLPKRRR